MLDYLVEDVAFLIESYMPMYHVKSRIQENKNKNAQNNNKTSGAVWLRNMVFNGKWWENFVYLGKEGAEKSIWSNMCSGILE